MNELEYWIAERAIRGSTRFFVLSENEKYSKSEIAHEMRKLIASEKIIVSVLKDKEDALDWTQVKEMNLEKIRQAIDKEIWAKYQITPDFGKTWESLSETKWDLFFRSYRDYKNKVFEITSLSENLIRRLLYYDRYLFQLIVDQDTLEWDFVKPWTPLYWKHLPEAHRVRCSYTSAPNRAKDGEEERLLIRMSQEAWEWYEPTRRGWYTNPFV